MELLTPASGSTIRLPTTFTWQRKSLPGYTYGWALFDPVDPNADWETDDLGDTGAFVIIALPSGAQYNRPYGWVVEVFKQDGGVGMTYYYNEVTIIR